MPTAVAIQCVEVTTPKVPSISGRVVKGLGLMLLIGGAFWACAVSEPPNHIEGGLGRFAADSGVADGAPNRTLIAA